MAEAEGYQVDAALVKSAATYLSDVVSKEPAVGIVCGSGLSHLAATVSDPVVVHYEDIPGFPPVTVKGHSGELVFGSIGGTAVVLMRGRFHSYEGNSASTTAFPIRVMALLGIKVLVITNASGGLQKDARIGEIRVLADQFYLPGLAGKHPLVGRNVDEFGPRFPPMSNAFDPTLQRLALHAADKLGDDMVRGGATYCSVSGPTYETTVESRFLRMVGGDAVGMSTAAEVIVARHHGVRVLGLSLITNKAVLVEDGGDLTPASHAEVLETVKAREADVQALVTEIVSSIDDDGELKQPLPPLVPPPLPKKKRVRLWAAAAVLGVVAAIARR